MNIGKLQGDVVVPCLFIVAIDWVMKNSNIDLLVSLYALLKKKFGVL